MHECLSLLALPDVEFATEPFACEEAYLAYARAPGFVPRRWTDADLAAVARSSELRLVMFDREFDRFDGIDVMRPQQPLRKVTGDIAYPCTLPPLAV